MNGKQAPLDAPPIVLRAIPSPAKRRSAGLTRQCGGIAATLQKKGGAVSWSTGSHGTEAPACVSSQTKCSYDLGAIRLIGRPAVDTRSRYMPTAQYLPGRRRIVLGRARSLTTMAPRVSRRSIRRTLCYSPPFIECVTERTDAQSQTSELFGAGISWITARLIGHFFSG
jgi:hypothetical protein